VQKILFPEFCPETQISQIPTFWNRTPRPPQPTSGIDSHVPTRFPGEKRAFSFKFEFLEEFSLFFRGFPLFFPLKDLCVERKVHSGKSGRSVPYPKWPTATERREVNRFHTDLAVFFRLSDNSHGILVPRLEFCLLYVTTTTTTACE
jgi:hypothetical protein